MKATRNPQGTTLGGRLAVMAAVPALGLTLAAAPGGGRAPG